MKKALGAALVLLIGAGAAQAQPARETASADVRPDSHRIIDVTPGGQVVIQLNRPFSSISVGNPDVVDTLPRSDRVFVILGKKVGTADIVIFDNANDIYKITAAVGAPRTSNRVLAHGKKDLQQYTAYECNPVCVRVKDELGEPPAQAPVILLPIPTAPPADR
jgi:hypothetical protein